MAHTLRTFILSEEGAASAEYAILAGLIAGVIVLAVSSLGRTVRDDLFQKVSDIFP